MSDWVHQKHNLLKKNILSVSRRVRISAVEDGLSVGLIQVGLRA